MKIAIFGGTFDPFHNEHRRICAHAAEQLKPDRLIVMPAKLPPHKFRVSAPAADRAEMARLGLKDLPHVEISAHEMEAEGPSYSYLTLEHFRAEHPEAELIFLIGGDSLRDFFTWKNPGRIAELATVAVVRRAGAGDPEPALRRFERETGKRPLLLDYAGSDISSTELKVLIGYGMDVSEWMPDQVTAYIAERGLYREHAGLIAKSAELLSEKRYRHTAYMAACAMSLAGRAGTDPEKTFVAAALHDVAKKIPDERLAEMGFVREPGMPEPVVHAFAGAYVAEHFFNVTDPEILNAIRYHTTGRPAMTQLEKVIYTADCVERSRDYEGVEEMRRAVEADFEKGFLFCLEGTMKLLSEKENKLAVSELTRLAYQYYRNQEEI